MDDKGFVLALWLLGSVLWCIRSKWLISGALFLIGWVSFGIAAGNKGNGIAGLMLATVGVLGFILTLIERYRDAINNGKRN